MSGTSEPCPNAVHHSYRAPRGVGPVPMVDRRGPAMKRIACAAVLTLTFLVLAAASPAVPEAEAVLPPFAVQRTALYAPLMYQHADDVFGADVDVDGDLMAVGSYGEASDAGAVYAFRRVAGVWSDPVRIVHSEVAAGDQFGNAVSVDVTSGVERIVIGSPYHHTANPDAGAVYVYKWSGTAWVLEGADHITAMPQSPDDHFGASVAIDNGYIAVGCPEGDDAGTNEGEVWVYRWSSPNWLLDGVVTCPTGSTGHALGSSIDIDATGDLIIAAGAFQAGVDGWVNCGAVCTFDHDTGSWTHHDTLYAPPDRRADGAWFGYDVAISDRRIIVGAPGKSSGGADLAGEAYTYTMPMNLWTFEQTLTNPNPSIGDGYDISVAAEGRTFLVGSWYENGYRGVVYPYTRNAGVTTAWPGLSG
ncbi:hypothetical protein EG835_04595, partial [bacterium]|nr:hypothetical protein [bacterium]